MKHTKLIQDMVKLGISYANAHRIAQGAKGQAAIALVSLIKDLHARGIIVVKD